MSDIIKHTWPENLVQDPRWPVHEGGDREEEGEECPQRPDLQQGSRLPEE